MNNSQQDICPFCNEILDPDSLYCSHCGKHLSPSSTPSSPANSLQWSFDIPFWDKFVVQGLAKAFGIPIFLLFCFLSYSFYQSGITWQKFIENNADGMIYTAILIGIMLIFVLLILFIVYKGRHAVLFSIDNQGAYCRTRTEERRISTTINVLLIFMSFVSGKTGPAGTGLLAQASQSSGILWRDVYRFTADSVGRTIVLHDSWHKALILYCTKENYDAALSTVQKETENAAVSRAQETLPQSASSSASPRKLWKPLIIFLLAVVLIWGGWQTYDHFVRQPKKSSLYTTREEYQKSAAALNKQIESSLLKDAASEILKHNYTKAIEIADSLLDANNKSINAYFIRGNAYYGQKNYNAALQDYNTILALEPQNASAYYNRALAHQALGNDSEALKDYQQSASLGFSKAQEYLNKSK